MCAILADMHNDPRNDNVGVIHEFLGAIKGFFHGFSFSSRRLCPESLCRTRKLDRQTGRNKEPDRRGICTLNIPHLSLSVKGVTMGYDHASQPPGRCLHSASSLLGTKAPPLRNPRQPRLPQKIPSHRLIALAE